MDLYGEERNDVHLVLGEEHFRQCVYVLIAPTDSVRQPGSEQAYSQDSSRSLMTGSS